MDASSVAEFVNKNNIERADIFAIVTNDNYYTIFYYGDSDEREDSLGFFS